MRAALDGSQSDSLADTNVFGKVFGEDEAGPSKGSGKGKERELVVSADLMDHTDGFLTGIGEWGIALPSDEWELGRLEAETSLAGQGAETETVAVSRVSHVSGLRLINSATLHSTTPTLARDVSRSCTVRILALLLFPHGHG